MYHDLTDPLPILPSTLSRCQQEALAERRADLRDNRAAFAEMTALEKCAMLDSLVDVVKALADSNAAEHDQIINGLAVLAADVSDLLRLIDRLDRQEGGHA